MHVFPGEFGSLSLRTKLLLVNFVVVACAVATLVILGAGSAWHHGRQMLLEDTRTRAQLLGDAAGAALMFGDQQGAAEILRTLHQSPQIGEAILFGSDGREMAVYRRPGLQAAPPLPVMPGKHAFGTSFLDVSEVIRIDGREIGHILLRADLGGIWDRLRGVGMGIGMALGISLLVAILLSWRLGQVVVGPILRLAQVIREVTTQSDYSRRAATQGSEEIASLARDFNSMIEQIERRNKVLIHELEQRRSAEARLEHLAHFDPLTGLPNRRHFHNRIEAAVSLSVQFEETLSLMFIDLDNFKNVNDTLGHEAGDELLRFVARALQTRLRANDIICRLGGDEFAVIIEGVVDDQSLAGVAAKLIEGLSQPIQLGEYGVHIGCSIGIARCPVDCTGAEALLRAADAAMYDAKSAGKNTFRFFHQRLHERMERRLRLEAALREVILTGDGLHLHYQPVWSLAERRIVAVEALCRWRHPEAGLVAPDEFIPIAEESELILKLGDWVLHAACVQGSRWQAEGLDFRVAVNVSGRQLHDPGFLDHIQGILEATGFPPSSLEIEFAESVLTHGFNDVAKVFDKLHHLGVKLVLDDFGAGYSSLIFLKRLPIDKLKIDRSFVRDLPDDDDDRSIARAIVALARSLNVSVQAEGVEQQEQFDYLEEIGCEYIQGFQIAKPLPADEVTALVTCSSPDLVTPGEPVGGKAPGQVLDLPSLGAT